MRFSLIRLSDSIHRQNSRRSTCLLGKAYARVVVTFKGVIGPQGACTITYPVTHALLKQRSFPIRGSVVLEITGTMTSSDFSQGVTPDFGLHALYRSLRLPLTATLFHRLLSLRSDPHTPEGSSGLHLQNLHPFHGLRLYCRGSAPSCPPLSRRQHNDAAGFTSCYGPQL